MRALELYSGIGGFAEAFTTHGEVVAAIDHNALANQVYASNFEHPLAVKNLDSIPLAQLERREADLWWMSPPCQPYTIRGAQRDLEDPRSKSVLRIIEALPLD
jgi:site-specific DNA-cytosine methylase